MSILNRDIFLQIKDQLAGTREEFVEIIPDVKARVVQLTCDAGFALVSQAQQDSEDNEKDALGLSTRRWICACVLDENGDPVFKMDDFGALPFELVQRLARVVNQVNGLTTAEATEEAEKN